MKQSLSKYLWLGATAVIFIYTAVVTVRNLVIIVRVNSRIARLEKQYDLYRGRIDQDSTLLEQLKYDEYLEQFAREKFHMQRANENIYIVED
ncbi:MAG: septum formation initiator family protein [Alistipes sp.]|nr:septum formation initiator family protein [Alistipes sp.]MBQ8545023.1 septum formation initiator family protein [Alistipes sp.]MBR3702196.1 septum formation initiator family protein [Alistipes sp.]